MCQWRDVALGSVVALRLVVLGGGGGTVASLGDLQFCRPCRGFRCAGVVSSAVIIMIDMKEGNKAINR